MTHLHRRELIYLRTGEIKLVLPFCNKKKKKTNRAERIVKIINDGVKNMYHMFEKNVTQGSIIIQLHIIEYFLIHFRIFFRV